MATSFPVRDGRRAARVTIKAVLALSVVLTIVFLISFLFSDEGIAELQRSRKHVTQLQTGIDQLRQDNQRLRAEIDSLQRSTFAVEKIAREDLSMSRPGEVIYLLPE